MLHMTPIGPAFPDSDIAALQAQATDLQNQINQIQNNISYAENQYAVNHFGGQTPNQFADYISRLNSQMSTLQAQLDAVNKKIAAATTKQQADQATAQTTAQIAATMPAQSAEALRQSVESYINQVNVLRQPHNDFGLNSARRNTFWGPDEGLGELSPSSPNFNPVPLALIAGLVILGTSGSWRSR